MIHIRRSKYFIPFNEYYFTDGISRCHGILQVHIQSTDPKKYLIKKRFLTLHIDLTQSEDVIFSEIKQSFRYEIKRAVNADDIHFTINDRPSSEDILKFVNCYDSFAVAQSIGPANRKKLELLSNCGGLSISKCEDESGRILAIHALVKDHIRCRLLYSGSFRNGADPERRALVGRANKAMHWLEIKRAKDLGFNIYDFGGLSVDRSTDTIDSFKKNFGGGLVNEYNVITLFGKI